MRISPRSVHLLILGALVAIAAAHFTCSKRPGKTTAVAVPRPTLTNDPNEPGKKRAIVPREEREKLGLTPKTWTGIVHPDVYPRFDKLDETVASMRERLRKGWDMQAFEILWSMSFQEPVYVEVQLKPGSNIRDTQRRVLRSLKASEFYTRQCFTDSPGLVGYASQEAIGKLVKNPEVVGICLDDKPLPDRGRIIRSGSLGPAKPGDTRSELDRAFGLTDRVDVVVSVPRGSLAPITTAPSNVPTQFEVERQAERQVRDRVLSTISADDFWLRGGVGSIMSGSISKEGYRKLQRNPDVLRIELPRLARPLEPRVQASSLAMLRLR